jgi:hypothetical protein
VKRHQEPRPRPRQQPPDPLEEVLECLPRPEGADPASDLAARHLRDLAVLEARRAMPDHLRELADQGR